MEESVLSDELEDSGWIGDKECVLSIFFENQAQTLLLLSVVCSVIGCSCVVGAIIMLGWLLDLRLVEEHKVPDLELDRVFALLFATVVNYLVGSVGRSLHNLYLIARVITVLNQASRIMAL